MDLNELNVKYRNQIEEFRRENGQLRDKNWQLVYELEKYSKQRKRLKTEEVDAESSSRLGILESGLYLHAQHATIDKERFDQITRSPTDQGALDLLQSHFSKEPSGGGYMQLELGLIKHWNKHGPLDITKLVNAQMLFLQK